MKIINKDFYYSGVNVEYDRENSCEESGCDTICRCSVIVNYRIESINLNSIVERVYSDYFDKSEQTKRDLKLNSILNDIDKTIDLYTIDKILRINRIWDKENWEINIGQSYYGEEVDSATLWKNVAEKIENQLDEAFLIYDLNKRIEYLLYLEYGYLLSELIDKNYKLETVKKEDIIFGSDGHYTKIQTEDLEHYSDKNYSNIRGVVIQKNDKYNLIDGYHRCFSTKKTDVLVLKAY
jgi:hypothetical protein